MPRRAATRDAPGSSTPAVATLCEITKRVDLGTEFGSDDFSSGVFGLAEGVRLVDCPHPVDARVNARLAAALDAADPSLRLWAAYALSRRLPLDARTLTLLAGYLNDTLPDLRERVRWSFRAQNALPDGVVDAVRVQDPALARELRPDDARRSPWG